MDDQIISVIIPVVNEAANLEQVLARVKQSSNVEIIVVDGGSCDETITIAQAAGVKVIESAIKGRANQMNSGAEIAQGEILLFLHGDTLLPPDYGTWIRETMAQPGIIGGAFTLKISGKAQSLRWVETLVNWRSRYLALPYGDQGIFLASSTFKAIGGFPTLPIMEDFELILILRKLGKIAIIPESVLTSGRRWQKLGVFKTTLINQLMILGYALGVHPEKLARLYKRF
ncbi:TIGR04283 family arsenosugar biosynthesis glycosyltransferase [Gloeocapsa sp. PCC 73106]|uniref:TIGR04283 family arsenosugar biosynthesis glycosyltransferase n=1 Tax=Gloeocapsa sp. PCC 73106 TaxID=102232 RepID=UPI0002AC44D2|nr:TIGR04283 family arsenosugar biosynthesis glycosyltransferase [Gloeocapsa sp. PCC 73106]ELR96433.1 glycosyl transferase [Gloeocapsa sp. PCC 73106]